MAIRITFDNNYNPIEPTFVLAKRNMEKIGKLNAKEIIIKDNLNDPAEITFTVYKNINGKSDSVWEDILDFRLIWCREWDKWFEITVETQEDDKTIKNVFCTEICQAELSQVNLYNNQFNTEDDIAREDYTSPTVFYDPDNPSVSLLNRMLEKMPSYHIDHVAESLCNIQRTFSFNDISLYDAFGEVAKEIHCLFLYDNSTNIAGEISRGISVYDLDSNCSICGYRGDFKGECPKCGSSEVTEGYGKDTTVFITADELADNIKFKSDIGAVKNCFRLVSGDELMDAAIRECNPNGSDYIWYLSEDMKRDMSTELCRAIERYDTLYNDYLKNYNYFSDIAEGSREKQIIDGYNAIVQKYMSVYDSLSKVILPIVSYPKLVNYYYDAVDFENYLQNVLMPSSSLSDTSAAEQAALLTAENMRLGYAQKPSAATADTIALQMAKAIVDTRYSVKIKSSSFNDETLIWSGIFTVENYSDENDKADSAELSVVFAIGLDGEKAYMEQRCKKILHDKSTADLSISGLFEKSDNDFKTELRKYCLNSLKAFSDACQGCLDILNEQGYSNSGTWAMDSDSDGENDIYEEVYLPFRNKLEFINDEITVRNDEIESIVEFEDLLSETIGETQSALDFQKFIKNIGEKYWTEFVSFRREDKYSNDNYISDGLDNAQLIAKAQEFLETAQREIYKSAEIQHTISTRLKNLLVIKRFKPFVNMFEVGSFMRIKIDNNIYKLRLIEYEIDFNNLENINVEFSDILKTANGMSDEQSLISNIKRMSTSYGAIQRQSEKGNKSKSIVDTWKSNGVNAVDVNLFSENISGQCQTWDEHGILCRKYDEVQGKYDDKQLKIINSTIAMTDDNWQTAKTAVGLIKYLDSNGNPAEYYGVNGEVIMGKMLIGQQLQIYNEGNNLRFDNNGLSVTDKQSDTDFIYNEVKIDPSNSNGIMEISHHDNDNVNCVFRFDENGNLNIKGRVTATSLTVLDGAPIDGINSDTLDLAAVAATGNYSDLIGKPDLSQKLDIPINHSSAAAGQIIQKTSGGSQWVNTSSTVSDNNSQLITSQAVFDYAFPKRQNTSNMGKYLYVDNSGNIAYSAIDMSGKMNVPINESTAGNDSVLIKTSNGCQWETPDSVPTENSSKPVSSAGIYNYAVPKTDISNAGKFLRYNNSGELEYLTIDDMKTLLGI